MEYVALIFYKVFVILIIYKLFYLQVVFINKSFPYTYFQHEIFFYNKPFSKV